VAGWPKRIREIRDLCLPLMFERPFSFYGFLYPIVTQQFVMS